MEVMSITAILSNWDAVYAYSMNSLHELFLHMVSERGGYLVAMNYGRAHPIFDLR